MNFVAIEAAAHPNVNILTFILMSNHVHFLMKAELQDVEKYMYQFKHRYSIYMRKKWGIKKFLKRNGLDIREIPYSGQHLCPSMPVSVGDGRHVFQSEKTHGSEEDRGPFGPGASVPSPYQLHHHPQSLANQR